MKKQRGSEAVAWMVVVFAISFAHGCLPDFATDEALQAQIDKAALDGALGDVSGSLDGQVGADSLALHDTVLKDLGTSGDGDAAADDSAIADGLGDGGSPDVQGEECITGFDCKSMKGQTPCRIPSCDHGFCVIELRAKNTACEPWGVVVGSCNEGRCDEAGSCAVVPQKEGATCGLNACMSKCVGGSCVSQDQSDWDDGNPCTKDYCGIDQIIKHDPITSLSLACDDGKLCTVDDTCDDGSCVGKPKICDDGVPCSVDLCEEVSGCVFKAQNEACPSDNPCVESGCDLALGCTVTGYNEGASCDDNNTCTDQDTCDADGVCEGSAICGCQVDADCKQDDLCQPMKCEDNLCKVDPVLLVICDSSGDSACAVNKCRPETGKCAPVAVNDGSPCADGDPCTEKESCDKGACVGVAKICDDNNPCTDESCVAPSGCVSLPNQATCDDDNPCTENDACAQGGCAATAKLCDDGATCTADSCDPKSGACKHQPQDAACDDGNPCTTGSCEGAKGCVYQPGLGAGDCKDDGIKCTTYACKSGSCVLVKNDCKCTDDAACDDQNPCTIDQCVAGECVNKTGDDGVACDSDDHCQKPGSGKCASGICVKTNAPKDCSVLSDACNTAACNPVNGECVAVPKADGTGCDADGDGCTVQDHCEAGSCAVGKKADCSKMADSCNSAVCQSSSAETFACIKKPVAKGTTCEDGDYCSVGDSCDDKGKCVAGKMRDCTDLDGACKVGQCDETKNLCVPAPKSVKTACNDGQFCTEDDHCDGKGTCIGGKARSCAQAICQQESCDEGADKCSLTPLKKGTTCSDDKACTEADLCDDKGQCLGTPVNCDDGNSCTVDACDAKTGKCTHKASIGAACSDGDPCTLKEQCDSKGSCGGGSAKVCQGDACNKGVCDGSTGVCSTELRPKGTKCDDSDKCTTVDACDAKGGCVGAAPLTCPGKTCMAGVCDPKTGACGFKPLQPGTPCSDGDACTAKDTCNAAGVCLSGQSKICDGDVCNDGICAPASGECGLKPKQNGTTCSDGNDCTEEDGCHEGQCKPGAYICSCKTDADCDDKNPCTKDACAQVAGKLSCVNTPEPKISCDDGHKCTQKDVCNDKGVCGGVAVSCDDNNKCTADFCDEATGQCATKALEGDACDDNDACTTGDICNDKGLCASQPLNCDDKNLCTKDSCDKGTCVHEGLPNDPCDDGLACTTSDKCDSFGKCIGQAKVCDDKKMCTADKCDAKTGDCVFTAKTGASCEDGDKCTLQDTCDSSGACVGEAKVCDDDNVCTTDKCASQTGACVSTGISGKTCDDGDKCTLGDTCDAGGKCVPKTTKSCAGDACNLGVCDPSDGQCDKKPKASGTSCDDKNACTPTDTCDNAGVCQGHGEKFCPGDDCNLGLCVAPYGTCTKKAKPQGTTCNDNNQCTLGDTCDAFGKCKAGDFKTCPGDPCNSGICTPSNGSCGKKPKASGTSCNDGDACTTVDACDGYGTCKGGSPVVCPDDDCNYGVCQKANGQCEKKPKANGTSCSDDNDCTSGDKCQSGGCQPGSYVCECKVNSECDDKNPCTKDTCVTVAGKLVCKNAVTLNASCDDGDKCTTSDKCDASGSCGGSAVVCDDNNSCTNDYCDSVNGLCVFNVSVGKDCDDGKKCTLNDSCQGDKSCKGVTKICNDGKVCTDDSCETETGLCAFVNNTASCNDGKKCTNNDTCKEGECAGVGKLCNDNNVCTNDACDPASGDCTFAANPGASCDDGNKCTLNDTCKTDKSCAGAAKSCDDANVCTKDSCSLTTGDCLHLPQAGVPCTDGNPCTLNDNCGSTGSCIAGGAKECKGDKCKVGYCDVNDGSCQLKNAQAGAPCSDGKQCTLNDACNGSGGCIPGSPKVCAPMECNTVSCTEPYGKCASQPLPKGTACEDGNLCTLKDHCDDAGSCLQGVPKQCPLKPCYKAACDPTTGTCKYEANVGQPCNDQKFCTIKDVCRQDGSCKGQLGKCNDGYKCTQDYCYEMIHMCKHSPNDKLCPNTSPKCKGYCKPNGLNKPSGCLYFGTGTGC